MINSLRIQNLATIKDVEILFDKGFTILTGETGAGKSIIIDGLQLVLGDKGSPDLIRTGQDEMSVEAVFAPLPQIPAVTQGLLSEPGSEVFIQRRVKRQGQAKGYIGGTLVPQSKLRAIGDDQVVPLSVERETRMSQSVPIVPLRLSADSHTAIHVPLPSVVTCG